MSVEDRQAVEQGFITGTINVICSTSTLAVGVNLPCYMVVLQGTVAYGDTGLQEYSDLEVMQMLGRAGRPQYEKSSCSAILTREDKVERYRKIVSGHDLLESTLHRNLIEHLNAEIGLGTVFDLASAKRWLASTFLYVRLQKNPGYYQLKEDIGPLNENEILQRICDKDISLLRDANLVKDDGRLRCTEFGDAMARYCIKFETMKLFAGMPPKAKMSEIASLLTPFRLFY
jgi:ATP-dependent DNA helicase HFM1/MER3